MERTPKTPWSRKRTLQAKMQQLHEAKLTRSDASTSPSTAAAPPEPRTSGAPGESSETPSQSLQGTAMEYEPEVLTESLHESLRLPITAQQSDDESSGDNFQEALKQLLGARYAEFETLSAVEKTSYVLGSEYWEDDFDALLHLVKEFIVAIWEVRKQKLYGDDSHPGQLQHQSSAGDRGPVAGVGGRVGKSGKSGVSHGKGEGHVCACWCKLCL